MELIKKLTAVDSPSGREQKIRDVIYNEVKDLCDEIKTDALGNLIVRKGSGGTKIALAAHMDEIGVVITFKDEKGFYRFAPVGGLDTKNLVYRRVRFSDGTVGVIGIEDNAEKNEISKMYIDAGDGAEINVGDMACFCGEFSESGNKIISKALDNRIGCYVLIEALKKLQNTKNEITFIFTVQEEVGLRGAKTAGFNLDSDYAIAVDVTDTGDTPECAPMAVKLGAGAAIKIMDRSVICHSEVRELLINKAKDNKIPYQLEILTAGGTDAGAVHVSGSGIKTGGISIPTRYIHSPSEMCDMRDVKSAIDLIVTFSN